MEAFDHAVMNLDILDLDVHTIPTQTIRPLVLIKKFFKPIQMLTLSLLHLIDFAAAFKSVRQFQLLIDHYSEHYPIHGKGYDIDRIIFMSLNFDRVDILEFLKARGMIPTSEFCSICTFRVSDYLYEFCPLLYPVCSENLPVLRFLLRFNHWFPSFESAILMNVTCNGSAKIFEELMDAYHPNVQVEAEFLVQLSSFDLDDTKFDACYSRFAFVDLLGDNIFHHLIRRGTTTPDSTCIKIVKRFPHLVTQANENGLTPLKLAESEQPESRSKAAIAFVTGLLS